MCKILKNNLCNLPARSLRRRHGLWLVLFIGLVTTFNYGGCGGGGGGVISGSSFTPSQSPSLTTKSATDITPTTAILNGTVNPNGVSTFVYFEYGTSTASRSTTNNYQNIGSGTNPVTVTATITGLSPNTLYNFRVVATNAGGTTTYGLDQTFDTSTPPPPTCTTNAATNVTYKSARLNGTVNPKASTNVYFQWGLTTSYGYITTSQIIGNETSNIPVNVDISGLSASTLYNFRIVATNAGGTTNGLNQTFTTAALPPPTCTTDAATNVTSNSARLNGAVNPNGSNTTAYFEWGTTISYGNTANSQAIGIGTGNVPVNADISGLSASTLYNFRCVATNAGGTTNGLNQTFTTTALPPPTCTTNVASNVISNSARLNGTVNPNGLDTTAYFQWGTTTSYGNTTTSQNIGSGTSNINVTANISGLSANTLYNFRVVGTSSSGTTTYGNNLTFTTGAPYGSAPTCTTNAANNITYNSARLNGTVNPNGFATDVYFNYGLTTSYTVTTTSQAIGIGTTNVPVNADISGLLGSTLYNFRVVGTNSSGTTYGNNLTFTTAVPPPPTCTTNPATNIAANSATLNGTVNPNGANVTSCYFDYASGTTPPAYGSTATATPSPGSGTSNVSVSANISSLSASTLYNFRVVATNAGGTTNGLNQTFTTLVAPPPPAVDDFVWVANNGSANITRITKSTLATTTIAVGTGPFGVAVDETYCWVANWDSNNVTRITKSTSVTTTIAVGTTPFGVAVDETYCWVANYSSANVTRITKSTLATTNIAVGSGPLGIVVDETYCWVANQGDNVTRITKSNNATTTIVVGSYPYGVAVDGTYCWVANWDSNNVTRIVKSTLATTNIAVGAQPISLGDMTGYAYDNYSRTTTVAPGSAPTVTINPATNITSNSATLNGTVNPNGLATTAYFQWGVTSYNSFTTSQAIGSGTSPVNVSATITGLSPNVNYYFQLVATNSAGTTDSESALFTAGAASSAPTVTTNPATNIAFNYATLNGTVNPNGLSTGYYFQWGLTTSYGSTTPLSPPPSIGSGTSNVNLAVDIAGLSPNNTYNVQLVAGNSAGTTYGNNLTFTTGAAGLPPTCTTGSATNVTYNSATLNGTVNPNGSSTIAYFQWGTGGGAPPPPGVTPPSPYTNTTPSQAIGSGTSNVNVTANISGSLVGGGELFNIFRVVATNSGGTTYGNDVVFYVSGIR